MSKPLLTVVVPTRDRTRYALSCFRSILELPSNELELVIQDQGQTDELEQALASWSDPRIRYERSAAPENHVENFNLAAARARGRFVTVIGDDDGIGREILQACSWAESEGVDALTPTQCATYHWPDFRHYFFGDAFAGRMLIPEFTGEVTAPDLEAELAGWARVPGRNTRNLPKVYHGIVRRDVLQRLFDERGACFFGVSPDIGSAIAVTRHVKKFRWIDYPLIIAGGSGGSAAGRGAMKTHKGSLREDPHMRGFRDVVWPEAVPAFYSVETVMAQSAIAGMVAAGREDLIESFGFAVLHGQCLFEHPGEGKAILEALRAASRKSGASLAGNAARTAATVAGLGAARIRRLAWRVLHPSPSGGQLLKGPYENVLLAAHGLEAHLRETGWSLGRSLAGR